ncbi:MAG: mycofactocin-associated electron transfer flavoprotein alpha subunit [Microthrixaceae bacterium]|nr:mycofactocin-associated electron transfer flavoprotein alpha subunit [Microthrixaceae bacterium]
MSAHPIAVVPVRAGVLPAGSAEVVAEALSLGDATVLLIGSQLGSAAAELAGVASGVQLAEVGDFAPARWAAALTNVVADASVVLLPASPDGRDLAARLAAAVGRPLVANAMEISEDHAIVVSHGGRVQHEVRPSGPFVATLQPGGRGVERGPAEVVGAANVHLPIDDGIADPEVAEVEPPDATTMDLAESPRIVGGGAGLMVGAGADDPVDRRFTQLTAIGEAIGASMGATRVVTDAGWVSHDRQIGTTGVVVDPDLYLAFGISGAVQHTAGLGHPEHIISVNTDPHCPMMAMADLAVVADANATLDELAKLLGVTSLA